MTSNLTGGRVEVVCGPMFAGKTTVLIRRLRAARAAGGAVLAVKPAQDTRYDAERIGAHDGATIAAEVIGGEAELLPLTEGVEMVGIDEAHFFAPPLAETCRALAQRGVRVVAAGVDLDHNGRPFDVMAALQRIADETTRLQSVCARCGAPADFTERLIMGEARIIVGGAGDYEPRCGRCFQGARRGEDGGS